MIWLSFTLIVITIGVAGYFLCRSADAIGEKLGLSQNWVGVVLLATVTSAPELIAGITAVSSDLSLPEMAVGNVLGGNVFNLMLVLALDLMNRHRPIYSESNHGHVLTAALALLLMVFVLLFYFLQTTGVLPVIWNIGLSSLIFPLLYLVCMKTIYEFEKKTGTHLSSAIASKEINKGLLLEFFLSAAAVISGGMALPHVGDKLITEYGWNQAFVGSVFMAIATSCPELAVSIAAMRLKFVNMALSNLLASNIFNLLIIFVNDVFYRKGAILLMVSDRNILTLISGMLMTSLVIVGFVYNPQKRLFNTVTTLSLVILAIYLFNNILLYKLGRHL